MQASVQQCLREVIKLYGYNFKRFSEHDAQGLEEYIYSKTGIRVPYTTLLILNKTTGNEIEIEESHKHALAQAANYIDWHHFSHNTQSESTGSQPVQITKLVLFLLLFIASIMIALKLVSYFFASS